LQDALSSSLDGHPTLFHSEPDERKIKIKSGVKRIKCMVEARLTIKGAV